MSDLFSEFAFAFDERGGERDNERNKERERAKEIFALVAGSEGGLILQIFFYRKVYLLCVRDQTYVSFCYLLLTRVPVLQDNAHHPVTATLFQLASFPPITHYTPLPFSLPSSEFDPMAPNLFHYLVLHFFVTFFEINISPFNSLYFIKVFISLPWNRWCPPSDRR